MRKDFFEEFCRRFAKETNRLRMKQRAGLMSAKREVERIGRRIKKLLDLLLDDEIDMAEGKPEMKVLAADERSSRRSSKRPTNRRLSCTRAWPTSTRARSKNSPPRSGARTRGWKPQRCSVD